jgi:hypothetical protein
LAVTTGPLAGVIRNAQVIVWCRYSPAVDSQREDVGLLRHVVDVLHPLIHRHVARQVEQEHRQERPQRAEERRDQDQGLDRSGGACG